MLEVVYVSPPLFMVAQPYQCYYHVRPQVVRYPPLLSLEEYNRRYRDHLFQLAKSRNVPREINSRWQFPSVLKLNTDGSSKGNPGLSSFGGLIRNSKGEWVCGYMGRINEKSCTSLKAEVMGIYYGLCLIRDKNYTNVLIETDCEAALMMIRGESEKDPTLKSVFDDIMTLIIQQKCGFCYTRRDGNRCADQLAKLGQCQFKEYIELKYPPILLIPYLERDTQAANEFQKLNEAKG